MSVSTLAINSAPLIGLAAISKIYNRQCGEFRDASDSYGSGSNL
jgi:hypothetical protein